MLRLIYNCFPSSFFFVAIFFVLSFLLLFFLLSLLGGYTVYTAISLTLSDLGSGFFARRFDIKRISNIYIKILFNQ